MVLLLRYAYIHVCTYYIYIYIHTPSLIYICTSKPSSMVAMYAPQTALKRADMNALGSRLKALPSGSARMLEPDEYLVQSLYSDGVRLNSPRGEYVIRRVYVMSGTSLSNGSSDSNKGFLCQGCETIPCAEALELHTSCNVEGVQRYIKSNLFGSYSQFANRIPCVLCAQLHQALPLQANEFVTGLNCGGLSFMNADR